MRHHCPVENAHTDPRAYVHRLFYIPLKSTILFTLCLIFPFCRRPVCTLATWCRRTVKYAFVISRIRDVRWLSMPYRVAASCEPNSKGSWCARRRTTADCTFSRLIEALAAEEEHRWRSSSSAVNATLTAPADGTCSPPRFFKFRRWYIPEKSVGSTFSVKDSRHCSHHSALRTFYTAKPAIYTTILPTGVDRLGRQSWSRRGCHLSPLLPPQRRRGRWTAGREGEECLMKTWGPLKPHFRSDQGLPRIGVSRVDKHFWNPRHLGCFSILLKQ